MRGLRPAYAIPCSCLKASLNFIAFCRTWAPEIEHVQISLPDTFLRLLRQLKAEHDAVLVRTDGISKAVLDSDFLAMPALEEALAAATQRENQVKGSQRNPLRALATAALIKYACLLHSDSSHHACAQFH